ncbi:AraC family transcriptional regulator [Pediococcus acidilactici]|uniref:AraC family transcriptional regulator n=1 Tax=Pediococcus acidilactici TaxID=1254 RepID=UPI0022E1C798|nr:helix-turn-helix domain-containing protein [Pediococcus acidilactici]
MYENLKNYLMAENSIEKSQKKEKKFIPDFPDIDHPQNANLKLKSNFFFKNKDVYVNKHNRYAPYPRHSHDFLELNYMFSGSCTQIIDNQRIKLRTHDIVLLDIGSEHSIEALGADDIMINVLFQNKNFNLEWLEKMKSSRNLLFDFIINSQPTPRHQKFIHFKDAPSSIRDVLENIVSEYFFPKDFSDVIIQNYLMVLLTEIIRNYQPTMISEKNTSKKAKTLGKIFKYISEDYATLTLTDLANRLNYNKNYISNLIKSETGHTFIELLSKQKIMRGHILITTTNMPITEIVRKVGFKNGNSFYKIYKNAYHELPLETRKKAEQ